MARPSPKVVEFIEPGGARAGTLSGQKRPRTGPDKERQAYLSGKVSDAIAVGSGDFKEEEPWKHKEIADDKRIRVDFRDMFKSVQSLGASSFKGKEKKVWEAKQLNALGADIKHKEKMPFKMCLGVAQARRKKERRLLLEEKAAGLVTGREGPKKKSRREVQKGPSGHPEGLDPDNVRGAVMLARSRMGKRMSE